jgi:hypothetical protein
MATTKTAVNSKLVFNQYRITEYADQTYRYENYPYFFNSQMAAIAWGRAYDNAQKELREVQDHINNLINQVKICISSDSNLPECICWCAECREQRKAK